MSEVPSEKTLPDVRTDDLPDIDNVLDQDPWHEVTIHEYPYDRRYRRSGVRPPQIGDIALCGHVKTSPPLDPRPPKGSLNCAQCLRLKGLVYGV